MKKRMFLRAAVAVTWITLISGTAYADAALSRLQALENAHQTQQAYVLAKQMSAHYAGMPEFDLLYGEIALMADKPSEAAFAYDRVLTLQPNNKTARWGLAEANWQLKDNLSAKRNFQRLLRLNPDEPIRQEALRNIQKIDELQKHLLTKRIGFIRVNGGYDTDTNAGPNVPSIFIPPGTITVLNPTERAVPSAFNAVSAGVAVSHAVDANRSFFADFSGFKRINYESRAQQFDYAILRGNAGFLIKKDKWRFTIPVGVQQLYIGDSIYENMLINSFDVSRRYTNNVFAVSLQSQILNYPRATRHNGHLFFGSFDWTYRPPVIPAELTTSLYGADGTAVDPNFNRLINNYVGLRVLTRWNGFAKVKPYVVVNYQQTYYKARDPRFRSTREDNFIEIAAAAEWQLSGHWVLLPSYSYSRNFSKFVMNRYTKNLYQVGLEYRIS